MTLIDENTAEQACLEWFEELGYERVFGPDIAPGGPDEERENYKGVVLETRFRSALAALNPGLPSGVLEDVARQVIHGNAPSLMQANRQFHRWLTDGVPVEVQHQGETLGDRAKLIDFQNPTANQWLVVNQFTIEGPKQNRRPDVIVFINGLPLFVIELKNPADENADIWHAFQQLQTYKEDIPDLVLLGGAINHLAGQTDGKKRFADQVLAASKTFALCCALDEAIALRDELAFFQAIKATWSKASNQDKALSDEAKELALRQIISGALVSDEVVDIFAAAGLNKPNIGILTDEFLDDVRNMKQRNLAVELLERLLKDDIKARFATNIVQNLKFSELLQASLTRYRNRSIETAQVIEEMIQMAKDFNEAARRGEELGLSGNELAFYDALETNEASVRELGDHELKAIARELTEFLRNNLTVDWSVRESVRAKMRARIKLILKRHKYPPDMELRAVELVLKQAEAISETWVA